MFFGDIIGRIKVTMDFHYQDVKNFDIRNCAIELGEIKTYVEILNDLGHNCGFKSKIISELNFEGISERCDKIESIEIDGKFLVENGEINDIVFKTLRYK